MMSGLSRARIADVWFAVAVVAGAIGWQRGQGLVFLLSLSLLAGVALLGVQFRLVLWPVGLMLVVLSAYGVYLWSWARGDDGISDGRARVLLLNVFVFWCSCAAIRLLTSRSSRIPIREFSWSRALSGAVLLAVPITLMLLVSTRTGHDPVRVISGHLSGGDHGAHNLIVHRLIDPTAGSELVSPFALYAYPRGIHYLIALLTAFDASAKSFPTVAREYLVASMFEYVQLAAVCQLSMLIVVGIRVTAGRVVMAMCALAFAMSVDNLVSHLFWSGFTTSLAVTWSLLIPAALESSFPEDARLGRSVRCTIWLFLGAFCWVAYQPFVVIGALLLISEFISMLNERALDSRVFRWLGENRIALVFFGSICPVLLPLLRSGKDSPAVTSLLADGSLYRPHLWTVILLFAGALLLHRIPRNSGISESVQVLVGVAGLAVGSMFVVRIADGPGLTNQPYYVQKILWLLLFLAIPLVLSRATEAIELQLVRRGATPGMATFGTCVVFLLLPYATGRTPAAGTRHFAVDWFARGIVENQGQLSSDSVAFSFRDRLGSHLANLALVGTSKEHLPIDTSLSANPFLACEFIQRSNVELIYTTPNGRAEMVESGCSPDLTYVEDGVVVPNPVLKFFGVTKDVEERTAKNQVGFRLLLRGFLPPEVWGVWAGGYRSAVGFAYESNLRDPRMEIRIRSNPKDEVQRVVVVRVNDEEVSRKIVPLAGSSTFEVPLPTGGAGTSVELTFTCERTSEEILADDPADGPEKCFGLETLTLRDGGAQ